LIKKNIDVVIHLISLDHKKSETIPHEVSNINILPTWNLLERFTNKGLIKFINFSSFQVYGNIERSTVKVTDLPNPNNMYGLSHYLSENIVNYYHANSSTECINIRLSNSFGAPVFFENNCWWLVVNDLVKSAYDSKSINLLSDGTPQRDFIDLYDICNSIETIIQNKSNVYNNTINLASGKTFTIYEIAELVKDIYSELYNLDIPITLNQTNGLKDNIQDRYTIDTSDLMQRGYKLKNDYKKSIKELFKYLEESNK